MRQEVDVRYVFDLALDVLAACTFYEKSDRQRGQINKWLRSCTRRSWRWIARGVTARPQSSAAVSTFGRCMACAP